MRQNDRHSVLGRFLYANTEAFNPLSPSGFSPAGNTAKAKLSDIMFSDTLILKSNMINVARVGYNHIDAKPNVTSGLGLGDYGWNITQSNPVAAGLPNIGITGFVNLGDAAAAVRERARTRCSPSRTTSAG